MHLLPYHTFTLQTRQSLPEVIKRLEAKIEPVKAIRWGFSRHHAPYEGTISESGFEMHRIIHYRNSFLPMIRGRFESSAQGTVIHITMKLHPFVIAFLIFWYLVWYSATIPIFLFGALSGEVNRLQAVPFLGLPILLLIIFWCAFWWEVNRSHQDLIKIISGEIFAQSTSSNLQNKLLWIVPITIIILWNVFAFNLRFSPWVQQDSQPIPTRFCADQSPSSPYCNFSVMHRLQGHPTASTLAISADGHILVSGGEDKAIKVWDVETGKLVKTLQSDSGKIQALAIAPDRKIVVSGSADCMVRIWSMTSNQTPRMLKGHTHDVRQVQISTDGKTIISRSFDEIKVWDFATGQLKTSLPNFSPDQIKIGPIVLQGNVPYFAARTISPDGKTALVELDNQLVLLDLATNHQTVLQSTWSDTIDSPYISLDGKIAVMTSFQKPRTNLMVWDLTTGTLKSKTPISSSLQERGLIDIALSRNLIFGNTQAGIKVWTLATGTLEATLTHQHIRSLVVSSEGQFLVGITGDAYYKNVEINVLHRP